MSAPLVHFVTGSTGAGKTIYAVALADRIGAVRFSIDEWMSALFWMDSPQPADPVWAIERIERCSMAIWSTATAIARRGVPVILELGLTTAALRSRFADLARAAGLAARLHFIDVGADERWRRTEARNRDASAAQLDFAVTREMFDFVETMWEPPTAAEMAAMDGVRVTS
ncbi:AAA family ATPase [uncultured Sphingomonas sp.]|uniref:AAA family ATPase n=1 Tax=uncultured Sphingomonas sp. TaxID=158754 RepID=UPI0035C996FB